MQSEARVAYTELLQSIYLEVQDCTNELHLLHSLWLKKKAVHVVSMVGLDIVRCYRARH